MVLVAFAASDSVVCAVSEEFVLVPVEMLEMLLSRTSLLVRPLGSPALIDIPLLISELRLRQRKIRAHSKQCIAPRLMLRSDPHGA